MLILSLALSASVAAPPQNNRKLQKILEQSVATMKPHRNQFLDMRAKVGVGAIVLEHKPVAGADAAKALEHFKSQKWEAFCQRHVVQSMLELNYKITAEFQADGLGVTQHDVTPATCAKHFEQANDGSGVVGNVVFGSKPSNEAAHAKITAYLASYLMDPFSAQTSCAEVSDRAWVWGGIGTPRRYGYIVVCAVNAKNAYGAYVGAKQFFFRLNADEFEHVSTIYKSGLMTDR